VGIDDNDSQQVHIRVEHRDSPNLAKLAQTRREQAEQDAAANRDERPGARAGEEAA